MVAKQHRLEDLPVMSEARKSRRREISDSVRKHTERYASPQDYAAGKGTRATEQKGRKYAKKEIDYAYLDPGYTCSGHY
jgi:hypothetical protein